MKIGFVGLGQMGKHMAMNLAKCGEELIVNDIQTSSFEEFAKRGIHATTNLQEITQCHLIFLSLPNSAAVKSVLLGKDGLLGGLKKEQIVADLSTIDYTASIEIAKALEKKGVHFMDTPVTGMEARAIDGTLTIMCGGEKPIYETLLPYLKYIGNKILYMGNHGCGQLTKAINNILFDINMAALAEVLPMAVKLGLEPETIGMVVNSGSGRSYASEFFIPRILKRNFSEGYPMKNAYKDLVCGTELSAQLCVPLPVMHAAANTYQTALLSDLGAKDKGAMICVYEKLLQVMFTKEDRAK